MEKVMQKAAHIKLLALAGAFIGPFHVAVVFLFSPFFSLPIALYAKFFMGAETIAFGPYLALAAGIFFVYGEKILSWLF